MKNIRRVGKRLGEILATFDQQYANKGFNNDSNTNHNDVGKCQACIPEHKCFTNSEN